MKRELNFWVLGGDLRQACLARLLAEDGHRVHTYALSGSVVTPTENLTLADSLDGIGRADCVVLPLPVAGAEGMVNTPLTRSALPLASLLDALSPPQILCGGRVDPVSAAMADARGADPSGLLRPGGAGGSQRCPHSGGSYPTGHGAFTNHNPRRPCAGRGLWPGGPAHRPTLPSSGSKGFRGGPPV